MLNHAVRSTARLILIIAFLLPPSLTLAGQEASVLLRPGSPSAPLDAYFDLADALGTGINQSVKVTISAHNTQKTAVKFKDVYLIDKSGTMVGVNAAKSDALQKDIPTTFIFQNFGASPTKLANVVGVRITFLSMGGDDPTDIVKVSGVQASVIRDIGESCVSIDPNILEAKEKPILTVDQVVNQDRRTAPVAGDGGGGGGGGAPGSAGPNFGTIFSSDPSNGSSYAWDLLSNLIATDGAYASGTAGGGGGSTTNTQQLRLTSFNFSIPTGATINGLEATVRRKATVNYQDATDDSIYFLKNNTANGSNLASSDIWATSDEDKVYGGPANLAGGVWTASDINNVNFGIYIVAGQTTSGIGVGVYVDSVKIKIYYTTGGGSVYDAFTDLIYSFSKRAYCLVTLSC